MGDFGYIYGFMLIFVLLVGALIGWYAANVSNKYECDGTIIMHDNELYLCITEKDKKAFETKCYAMIRLQREKFHGFNET